MSRPTPRVPFFRPSGADGHRARLPHGLRRGLRSFGPPGLRGENINPRCGRRKPYLNAYASLGVITDTLPQYRQPRRTSNCITGRGPKCGEAPLARGFRPAPTIWRASSAISLHGQRRTLDIVGAQGLVPLLRESEMHVL